jgi:hypothetical protein
MKIKKKKVKVDRLVEMVDCPYWNFYVETDMCKKKCGNFKAEKKGDIICNYKILTLNGKKKAENGAEKEREKGRLLKSFSKQDEKKKIFNVDGMMRDLSTFLSNNISSDDKSSKDLEKKDG